MSGATARTWTFKLPIYFAGYHCAAVVLAMAFQQPQLITLLDLPVAPLFLLLALLADKGVFNGFSGTAVILFAFFAMMGLWVLYGYWIGRFLDKREQEGAPRTTSWGHKVLVVASIWVVCVVLWLAR